MRRLYRLLHHSKDILPSRSASKGARALRIAVLSLLVSSVYATQGSERHAEQAQLASKQELATLSVGEESLPKVEADGSDAVFLPPIVVTASKRQQLQRELAASVDVLRGQDLEMIYAAGLADYLKQVPGVVLIKRRSDASIPIIRGLSTSTAPLYKSMAQLPVGIYIGDMPYTDLYLPISVPDLHPFDLERVEILKGPQGTLFGSGALTGAIRYLPKQPELGHRHGKLHSSVSANHESGAVSSMIAGALNLPLDKDAALRAVADYQSRGGLIDEYGRNNDVDASEQYGVRLLGTWMLDSRLQLRGFYIAQQTDQDFSSQADNPKDFNRENTGQQNWESGFSGANFITQYSFDTMELLSSSNYLSKDIAIEAGSTLGVAPPYGDFDGDGGNNGPGTEDVGSPDAVLAERLSQSEGLFQEFRLASSDGLPTRISAGIDLQWLIGLAYQRTQQDLQEIQEAAATHDIFEVLDTIAGSAFDTTLNALTGNDATSLLYVDLASVADEKALFGELTASMGEHWRVTLGLRAFMTKLRADGYMSGAQVFALNGGDVPAEVHRVTRAQGVNPKLAVQYLFNEHIQIYALASKGFQFGGVQANPPVAALNSVTPEAFQSYDSSKLWNYEIGLRGALLKNRLNWELTAFYLDWDDLQITVRQPLFPSSQSLGLSVGVVENIGRARSQGVELGLNVALWDGLLLSSNAAWINAITTQDFDSSGGFVAQGTRLPGSAKFQCSNRLSYTPAFSKNSAWTVRMHMLHAHLGTAYNDLQYSRQQGGYDTFDLNFSVGRQDIAGQPELSLSLLNAGDVRGISAISGDNDDRDIAYYFIPPRTLQLGLSLSF